MSSIVLTLRIHEYDDNDDEKDEYNNDNDDNDDQKEEYNDDNEDYKGWSAKPDGERGVISGWGVPAMTVACPKSLSS